MTNPHKGRVKADVEAKLQEETKAILLKSCVADAVEHYRKAKRCDYATAIDVVTKLERAHFATTRDPQYPSR